MTNGSGYSGFSTGAFITISFAYIGEITPTVLRGIVSSAAAISFTLGPFLVALIVKGTGTYGKRTPAKYVLFGVLTDHAENRWAYRSVFVAQYAVAAIGTIFLPFMPEVSHKILRVL